MAHEPGSALHAAWLALQCAGALHPVEVTRALRDGATPQEALAGLPRAKRPGAAALRVAAARLEGSGARLLPWDSPDYPARLRELRDAPPVLALRGDPSAWQNPVVGIVGSRAATADGLRVARRLARELSEAGVTVVSGLAYGVDAAAHRGALEGAGATIAVQACGLDHVYPARHRALADAVAGQGALLSEFPPGTRPRRSFFPLRNRLISALSQALVVVEARERSGSLVSARWASNQGVDVFAVPGPITVATHLGSNRLLREGAMPLLETRDVLEALAWPSVSLPAPPRHARLSPLAESLRALLEHEALDSDTLARRVGRPPAELAAALLEMELLGAAGRDRDGRWRLLG